MEEVLLRVPSEKEEKREMKRKVKAAYYLIGLGSPFDRHLNRCKFGNPVVAKFFVESLAAHV